MESNNRTQRGEREEEQVEGRELCLERSINLEWGNVSAQSECQVVKVNMPQISIQERHEGD